MIRMYDLAGAEDNRLFSPYGWRIRMAMAHKGLKLETIPWRFTEKDKIAFSGQGKVPVLIDGDNVIFDSWTIAHYLEDTYTDTPSIFGGEQAKAQTLFIKHWSEKVVAYALHPLIIMDIFAHVHPKDKQYYLESRTKMVGKSLEEYASDSKEKLAKFGSLLYPLRATLDSQPFLAGKQPNFADYIVFGMFQWARCISPMKLLAVDDPVYAWRARMLDLYDGLAAKALGYEV